MGVPFTLSASSARTNDLNSGSSSSSPDAPVFASVARMRHPSGHWKNDSPLFTSRAAKTPTPPGPFPTRTASTSPPSCLIHSRSAAPRLSLSSESALTISDL